MTTLVLRWHAQQLAVAVGTTTDLVEKGPIYGSLTTPSGTTLILPYPRDELRAEGPFRAIEIQGPLDFALTGILASVLVPLRDAEISVFTLSTFDTDWILVRESDVTETTRALTAAGHRFEEVS